MHPTPVCSFKSLSRLLLWALLVSPACMVSSTTGKPLSGHSRQTTSQSGAPVPIVAWYTQAQQGPENLVYTTVGGSGMILRCLNLLLTSLAHFSPQPQFTFLIILTEPTLKELQNMNVRQQWPFTVEYFVLDPAKVDRPGEEFAVAASFRKIDIYQWPNIKQYRRVLFLDADVLAVMDVAKLFSLPLQSGILYAAPDHYYMRITPPDQRYDLHRHLFWSLQNYTDDDIARFKANQVHVVNAGIYTFVNDDKMLQHFANIRAAYMEHKGPYFYEQSFLNYYFNTRLLSNITVLGQYTHEHRVINDTLGTYNLRDRLVHFSSSRGMSETYMQQFYEEEVVKQLTDKVDRLYSWLETLSALALSYVPAATRSKHFSTMGHIGQVPRQVRRYYHLALNPNIKTICEIGFNAGHSAAVYTEANPGVKLYIFDLMELPYSNAMMAMYRKYYPQTFHYVKGSSFDTVPWMARAHPEVKCDLFSVDGLHSYEGALTDFINALAMMPPGAVLLADDTSVRAFPGCKKAFEEIVEAGYLRDVHCEHPFPNDLNTQDAGDKRWCWGTATQKAHKQLAPPIPTQTALAFTLDA